MSNNAPPATTSPDTAQNERSRIQAPPAPTITPPERLSFWQKLQGGDLRYLVPRLKPHSGKLSIAAAMLLASTAMSLVFPTVVGRIMDTAFGAGGRQQLDRTVLFLLALFSVQAVMTFCQAYLLSASGERIIARLREDLFAHLLRLPPAFFADRRTGELTSRLGTDVSMLQGVLTMNALELLKQTLLLIGALVMLTVTHVYLTGITLLLVPIVVGTAIFFGERLKKASQGVMDEVAEASAIAEESFSQIRVVQSFVGEPHEQARYGARITAAVSVALRRAVTRGFFYSVIGFVSMSASVLVLWVGGRMVLAGTLTVGTLFSFLLYSAMAANSVGALGALWSAYQESMGAAARVFQLLRSVPRLRDADNAVTLAEPITGAVEFSDVWFRYEPADDLPKLDGPPLPGQGRARSPAATPAAVPDWTLRGISFRINPGETVALVGPSGAGKTTIAALIPRFWDVQKGAVSIEGTDVRELRLAQIRDAIGLVPQETLLFSGSVRDNISYARPDATEEQILAAARAAHAHEFVRLLPEGYDTRVGERGVKLSGGQRQRIALARAILKDPAVLILDEATSSLDTESEALIEDALNTLLQNRTTLIIAHRLSTVRRANRILVLENGGIAETGTHNELIAAGGLYARLYAHQFRDREEAAESLMTV
ncbi:ABC transporter ATP-binding protein [Longimicrobium terrae]|uniref:Subfamily B ATP-binding cassette protein MsbA n=1 Tax=Longimicrobium terrae TaxID=1639882 RepID=A0A841GL23_9BACT|nr:ABC transporter transmembrane domain-containing protein [Longimicrobium terrae]MBB4634902.1 subfamily B ATP-binding cassette protein MsbA [Longimicrobium terrae]MBB6069297.1 subfamily B ATP-binding cassette protein MsbA [Longimicrobium terrae]